MYVLYLRGNVEYVCVQDRKEIITDTLGWHKEKMHRHWSYCGELHNATLFDTEHLAQLAKEHFCNFPWIIVRPLTVPEFEIYANYFQPKQSVSS